MNESGKVEYQGRLLAEKEELKGRLERIRLNVRRKLDADSAERATQVEDHEVVDALGNEARDELAAVQAALDRIANGSFGVCVECGAQISSGRLAARPSAARCIRCASAATAPSSFA